MEEEVTKELWDGEEITDSQVFRVAITDEEYLQHNNSIIGRPTSSNTNKYERIIDKRSFPKPHDKESFLLQNDQPQTSSFGIADMATMNYLHEASILDNLRIRFLAYQPYTYTGNICIAINPYQWLDHFYTPELRTKFNSEPRHLLEPHVYAISASAYHGLRDENINQSILVSGESGAGKTETVKILMKHIAQISGKSNDSVIQKIIASNPLLESFGNAKTTRNDNSSRFGKFIQLLCDKNSNLVGSRCETYLLEKTRVVTQSSQERNFHIFHELFAAPTEVKSIVYLNNKTAKDFYYCNKGDCKTTTIENISDTNRFLQTMQSLSLIDIDSSNQMRITQILSAILHLGEVKVLPSTDDSSIIHPESFPSLKICCALLGVDYETFSSKLTSRLINVSGDVTIASVTPEQAYDTRDALAKEIYSLLFNWLVNEMNQSLAVSVTANSNGKNSSHSKRSIGLLDIFGFESFQENNFEQLCINYANEKLQQKFTTDVLSGVQHEYQEEGLDWENIEYKDNADILDILDGKRSILSFLNDECVRQKGNNTNYYGLLIANFSKNSIISFPPTENVNKFLEKNKDTLSIELKSLLSTSINPLVANIFSNNNNNPTNQTTSHHKSVNRRQSFFKSDTVLTQFKQQLSELMEAIGCTQVQYVRCIKPNTEKSSIIFNRHMVMEQLKCSGIIAAVKVSRAAYPNHLQYVEFYRNFKCLRNSTLFMNETDKSGLEIAIEFCQKIMNAFSNYIQANRIIISNQTNSKKQKLFEFGATKVYFSSGVLECIEKLRISKLNELIILIQRKFQTFYRRKQYKMIISSFIKLQAFVRKFIHYKSFKQIKNSILLIQTIMRRIIAKKNVMTIRYYQRARCIQSYTRRFIRRKQFLLLKKAVITLGAIVKMKIQQKKYRTMILEYHETSRLSIQLDMMTKRLLEESELRSQLELSIETQKQELMRVVEERGSNPEAVHPEILLSLQLENEALKAQLAQMKAKSTIYSACSSPTAAQIRRSSSQSKESEKSMNLSDYLVKPMLDRKSSDIDDERQSDDLRNTAAAFRPAFSHQPSPRNPYITLIRSQSQHLNNVLSHDNNEVELLQKLQSEMIKLRNRNELLEGENSDLKSEIKRLTKNYEARVNELHYHKSLMDIAEKDRDSLSNERERLIKQIEQYKVEKKHLMELISTHAKEACESKQALHLFSEELAAQQLETSHTYKAIVYYLLEHQVNTDHIRKIQKLIKESDRGALVMDDIILLQKQSQSFSLRPSEMESFIRPSRHRKSYNHNLDYNSMFNKSKSRDFNDIHSETNSEVSSVLNSVSVQTLQSHRINPGMNNTHQQSRRPNHHNHIPKLSSNNNDQFMNASSPLSNYDDNNDYYYKPDDNNTKIDYLHSNKPSIVELSMKQNKPNNPLAVKHSRRHSMDSHNSSIKSDNKNHSNDNDDNSKSKDVTSHNTPMKNSRDDASSVVSGSDSNSKASHYAHRQVSTPLLATAAHPSSPSLSSIYPHSQQRKPRSSSKSSSKSESKDYSRSEHSLPNELHSFTDVNNVSTSNSNSYNSNILLRNSKIVLVGTPIDDLSFKNDKSLYIINEETEERPSQQPTVSSISTNSANVNGNANDQNNDNNNEVITDELVIPFISPSWWAGLIS
eukprot:gene13406-17978_t